RRTRSGEGNAAHQLVEWLYPCVLRTVRTHRPFAMDEGDLVQEVFYKVFAKLDTFRGDQPLDHWVSRIARNLCFDYLRRQRRRGEMRYADLSEGEEELLEATLSREMENGGVTESPEEVRVLLEKLLATLKPSEAQVLRMLDLEEQSVRTIAEELGWGESRVKVTAFRARKKLRATLSQWEEKVHE
ncbi:MAG: RNA polymerase sigma factor, partial [Verrucomicrobiota bacterium]